MITDIFFQDEEYSVAELNYMPKCFFRHLERFIDNDEVTLYRTDRAGLHLILLKYSDLNDDELAQLEGLITPKL